MTWTIAASAQARVKAAFGVLNTVGAGTFPRPIALTAHLESIIPPGRMGAVAVNAKVASLFGTAAVDIWLRAIHSLLISAALTRASPLWASVAGYYSSHYSVRGIAHLLGYFTLHRKKLVVQLNVTSGHLTCDFMKKGGGDGEHLFYWKVVHRDEHFASDPLFPLNDDGSTMSDSGHRGRANYGDHVERIPAFHALGEHEIKRRLERISEMLDFDAPPLPSWDRYPDVDSVQIVAYQRIIRFRQFLDQILGATNRFWEVHRNPPPVRALMDFQVTEQSKLTAALTP